MALDHDVERLDQRVRKLEQSLGGARNLLVTICTCGLAFIVGMALPTGTTPWITLPALGVAMMAGAAASRWLTEP